MPPLAMAAPRSASLRSARLRALLASLAACATLASVSSTALADKGDKEKGSNHATTSDDDGDDDDDGDKPVKKKKKDEEARPTTEPPAEEWNPSNVEEVQGKSYFFVGAIYRGNIIPKFLVNLLVDEGATVYSNTVGVFMDYRKDHFSLVPSLVFTEYGTGDVLFKQKNTPDIAGNYSLVNSSMKSIQATMDILWSSKVATNIDVEYGIGVGIGVFFGDLETNWVYEDSKGPLAASNGKHYTPCTTTGNVGCNPADHQNSQTLRVNHYLEPSWFGGGSKPNFFPYLSLFETGLRFKPVKQFEGRVQIGFALTGPWFGLSGAYGLEHKPGP